jgi:ankyrin repeat protein
MAARTGDAELVRVLVEAGADLNVQESEGWTALMLAANGHDVVLAEVLLNAGASHDLRLPDGRTAVDLAGEHGRTREALSLVIEQREAGKREDRERWLESDAGRSMVGELGRARGRAGELEKCLEDVENRASADLASARSELPATKE